MWVDNSSNDYAQPSDDVIYMGGENGQNWANYDQINDSGWTAPAVVDVGYSGGGDYGGGGGYDLSLIHI